MPRTVLVTGGRDYKGPVDCLSLIQFDLLVHGGARGADSKAAAWAESHGLHTAGVNALWCTYGRKAGPIRNGIMLALCPEMLVAFPGGKGTADMVKQAEVAGVPVWRPYG